MMDARASTSLSDVLRHNWGWLLALGLVQIVLGTTAICVPIFGTVATALFVGWLFLAAGVAQVVHAFQGRGAKGFFLHLLSGLLYLAAGGMIVLYPMSGAFTLTAFLAAFLLVEGGVRVWLGLHLRPAEGWGWVLVSGVLGVFAGAMIWSQLPSSAIWALGTLVGINFLFSGVSLVSLALRARSA
ncbi:MAG TPA: HdeD family acid-resistance protein [Myxococcota bacterium]|nr:HdeD family acid-resistance protein [Myxococcota bacterium]